MPALAARWGMLAVSRSSEARVSADNRGVSAAKTHPNCSRVRPKVDARPLPQREGGSHTPLRLLLAGTSSSVAGLTAWAGQLPTPATVVHTLTEAGGGLEPATLLRYLDEQTQETIDLVVLSLPAAMAEATDALIEVIERRAMPWRWVPTLSDQLAGRVRQLPAGPRRSRLLAAGAIPTPWAEAAGLLDRRPAPLDETAVRAMLHDRVVLVTGAGGSIGSELVRQAARFGPRRIILVERAENALFEIDRQMAREADDVLREAVLHDVTDSQGTEEMLARHRPAVIFHAAAHKHVPMMEEHPAAAVENNFYGTRSIANAADRCGVERFVMISSDKAVNPSSVMGATKRLAELYIQHLNESSATRYCMVRFGNVLGSACSVLPIWQKQLGHGGPITVTHPQMQRYFMTIPEAAGLVLQSAALTGQASRGGGEVFLLDMGDPVRIVDLAERFLRSQGLEPGIDVAITFTGIRPGEKLFEELAYSGEDMLPTPHAAVRVWKSSPPTPRQMQAVIARFDGLRQCGQRPWQGVDRRQILHALRWAVPEMVAVEEAGEGGDRLAVPRVDGVRAAAG